MRLVPLSTRLRRGMGEDIGSAPSLRDEMDRLLERHLRSPLGFGEEIVSQSGAWIPSVDISENENEIFLRADVPGVDPERINITVSGNRLIVSGEKSEQEEQQQEHFYYCERRFGSFERAIEMPSTADLENVSAEYDNGVLTIHVPKHETAKPKRIPVAAKSGDGKGGKQPVRVGEGSKKSKGS